MAKYAKFDENPLESKNDFQKLALDLLEPLMRKMAAQGAALDLHEGAAIFDMKSSALEGVARPLWGIIPLEVGGGHFPHWCVIHRAIAEGVNPNHPHYWGETGDRNQRSVEMAAIGLMLALTPEKGWDPLPQSTKIQLVQWLAKIQQHEMPQNNWLFFTLLVQAGLAKVGYEDEVDHDLKINHLEKIKSWYLGDGWYGDGDVQTIDHYGGFAMHYYGLIYAFLIDNPNDEYAELFSQRAIDFIKPFAYWFADSGEALPLGRSLCYRFACAGFWGGAAMLPLQTDEIAKIKGLWARHIRSWQSNPIFSDGDILSRGYLYPNLVTAECYNSPTSPYWAMKAFLPLLLPDDHVFWSGSEEAYLYESSVIAMPSAQSIAQRVNGQSIVHFSGYIEPKFQLDKYNKFAYSTAFGPEMDAITQGHRLNFGDNIFAFSFDEGSNWQMRQNNDSVNVNNKQLCVQWTTGSITVNTEIEVHTQGRCIRRHSFKLERPAWVIESGFAVHHWYSEPTTHNKSDSVCASILIEGENGKSSITSLDLYEKQTYSCPRVHSNLISPRSQVPFLLTKLEAGEHILESEFTAIPNIKN
ncbi:DUF2264 domain-containing protein [Photobacterium satsumensis]|uniref:DUF2264 domain-containing protein n=1 Tax=Photobacterium satsumensis TaxID=2910239 RepID=UPI003D139D86